jgi:hypothetical protein
MRPIVFSGFPGNYCGNRPSGTIAGDDQAFTVNTKFSAFTGNPLQNSIAIIYGSRERMFRCKAVINCYHYATCRICQGAKRPVMGFQITCNKPSAMEEDDSGQITAS